MADLIPLRGRAARPGGGHSYSSPSHSSSSSSSHSSSSSSSHYTPSSSSSSSSSSSYIPSTGTTSSSSRYYGADDDGWGAGTVLITLGIACVVAIVVVLCVRWYRAYSRKYLATIERMFNPEQWTSKLHHVDRALVLDVDPDFSQAVFEDLAFQLYATAHRARADQAQLFALAPYLSPAAMSHLAGRRGPVQFVVVGALKIGDVATHGDDTPGNPNRVELAVSITANLVGTQSVIAVEHWVFSRAVGVRTRPPQRTQTWPCPNCGAPWSVQAGDPRHCAYCGTVIQVGKLDWAVTHIGLESETSIGPTLTGTVEEQGNDLPTIVDDDAQDGLDAITADDPAVTWDALGARIRMIYAQLNVGWNALDLAPARGLVTSSMLHYLSYWTSEYRRQGLCNRLEDAAVTDLELAHVLRDHYFDAITVRVFATGHDFTLDTKGHVVGGSRTSPRAYTEYWTFLRSSTRRGPVGATPTCPNCGTPLAISDAGTCTSCGALVDNGSFDWVLSKIEQDDAYL